MSALFEEYWNAGGVILLTYKEFNNLDIESKDTNTNIIGLVVGFAIIIPFTKSSILKIKATLLETGTNFDLDRGYFKDNYGIDIDISWYIADLGVDKSLRRHGIATKLIDLVCSLIPEQKSNKDNECNSRHILMRVSKGKDFALSLYIKVGFTLMDSFKQDAVYNSSITGTTIIEKVIMWKLAK